MQANVVVDSAHAAHEPPEARGVSRDNVRLMVSPGAGSPVHSTFRNLPEFLSAGDLVVVNTSATIPAAIDVESATLFTGATATTASRAGNESPGSCR